MNRITLTTNLDGVNIPRHLGEGMSYLPPIGSYIILWCGHKRVKLEVVSIIYDDELWIVELHVPKFIKLSVRDWYRQYCDIVL